MKNNVFFHNTNERFFCGLLNFLCLRMWVIFEWFFIIFTCLSLGTWLVPWLIQALLFKPQNLRAKYAAEATKPVWAVVTGGSSGIGLALSKRLAGQGINVFIVALDDRFMASAIPELKELYPQVAITAVPVDLSDVENAVETVGKAKEGHAVHFLFNNAGFVSMCLFADTPVARQMANFNVNLTISVRLTHLFAGRMIADPSIRRGAICYTSSPSGMMPNPFAAIYGMTKAAMTEFAVSVAPELRPDGIDVLVVHPSPVDTNFYTAEATSTSPSLALFRKTATTPDTIAACFFAQLGRAVVYDQGYFPLGLRLLFKVLDSNLFAFIVCMAGKGTAEFQRLSAERKNK